MTEKIGNVVLDMTYYPGEDHYSDGDIEDELLQVAMEHEEEEFPKIIEERKSWPFFYHLSPFRTNIIDWLPFKKTDRVLEIGSGCGAITGALAKRVGSVTCIDLSKKRSLVNAYRNKKQDNITIMVGNFKDIEPHLSCDYDYVLLIGVFEYGRAYIGGETPYEDFMSICNRHRKDSGRLVIAIENKFGLKYWAGCREDHLGTYFTGIEGYHTGGVARTFTRRGLEEILHKTGISEYAFYYPYPDYKFPTTIYSDEYMPKKGELSNNLRNFDRDRVLLFDEKQVFDQVIEEGEFPLFSNSYLLLIGKKPQTVYAKFSNDRAKAWAIRTLIHKSVAGTLLVEKQPNDKDANAHIVHTYQAYEALSRRYEGTKVQMNECKRTPQSIVFPFCPGKTLEELLDERLDEQDAEGFRKLIEEYMYLLSYNEDANISNIDFIFPNILVDGDTWHVIDYEWTFDRKVPAKDIAFRAFYNYLLGGEGRKACEELLMQDVLHLTEEEKQQAIQDEQDFQHYVTGDRASVSAMRELIGFKAYELSGMEAYCVYAAAKYVSQVFYDYGEGFSQENSILIHDCFTEEKDVRFTVDVPKGVKQIRIDPCSYRCAVTVKDIAAGEQHFAKDNMTVNGVWANENCVIFDTEDPNLVFACEGADRLDVTLEVVELPESLTATLIEVVTPKENGLKRFFH